MHTLQPAYIVATGSYLPGPSIDNEHMEAVLGLVAGKKSRYRKRILKSNGIESRHYALGEDGKPNVMSEEMAAFAIQDALAQGKYDVKDIQMLAVGTSIQEILVPGIASQVHGRLGERPMEIMSCHGVCGAGAAAIKSAYLNVRCGEVQRAVAAAVERPSAVLRGNLFAQESEIAPNKPGENGEYAYFNADFLRWMLSDGAGASVIQNTPHEHLPSLRIDWIEAQSYAHELPVCMTLGTNKGGDIGIENTWNYELENPSMSKFLLRQDTRLLEEGIATAVAGVLVKALEERQLDVSKVDHFLPHISSYFFEDIYKKGLAELGQPIADEKWFTNLKTKGNTGSASIFIMLDEALRTNRFKHNDSILLMIPESGRFSATYIHLTCQYPSQ